MASVSVLQDPSLRPRHQQTLTLSDDRVLGYAEFGSQNADATALFVFHGLPGSRLDPATFHGVGCELNVRVIGTDRPGIGLSSPQPTRKLLDWPADVRQLARHLNLDRYYVLGISGGGPYALACAHQLPGTELLGVGLMASLGPWHLGTAGMALRLRVLLNSVAYAPWLARRMLDATFAAPAQDPNPDTIKALMESALASMTPADQEYCLQPDVLDIASASLRESYKNNSDAMVDDGRVLTSDWGFKLDEISVPKLRLWYGTEDNHTPLSLGQYLADHIPNAVMKEFKGATHHTIHYRSSDILKDLVVTDE